MKLWYVVYTQPRAEDRALWHLRNQGFDCFMPRCRKTRRHARKAETVLEPLFPRYLFTRFDANTSRWASINGTRGVINLLSDGTRPLPVPGAMIEELLAAADGNGITPLTALGMFSKGRKVRIKNGPFTGQIGEVTGILSHGRDRVQILLCMLGVETNMQVSSSALEYA